MDDVAAEWKAAGPELHHLGKCFGLTAAAEAITPGKSVLLIAGKHLTVDPDNEEMVRLSALLDADLLDLHARPPAQQPHGLLARIHIAVAHLARAWRVLSDTPNRVCLRAFLDERREAAFESQEHYVATSNIRACVGQ